ncbi:MAG TPA: hypothetical protein VN363_03465 [Anaerolineales bacterium]|nr:hypothetical protein [Anaerolineales bacterium]
MFKKILLFGLLLGLLSGCGLINFSGGVNTPQPVSTTTVPGEIPAASATPLPEPTKTIRIPSRSTPTPGAIGAEGAAVPPQAELPVVAPVAVQVDLPLYAVQPGTPAQVTNFLAPEAGCSYLGIAGQIFDERGQPVTGLIIEISGSLDGEDVLQLALSGGTTRLGPGGFVIQLADRAIASQGTLSIQIFDLGGLALSDQVFFDTSAECDSNQILLNFTAAQVEYDQIRYFPFLSNR